MKTKRKIDVKALTVCSLLAAMGVVCKAMLSINITIGSTMLASRLGIHVLFIYLAAINYGPLLGAITGGAIDIWGTLLEAKYPINPAYTLTLALTGAAIWVVFNFLDKKTNLKLFYKILLTVILIQTLVTYPLNTFWNSVFYTGFNLFWAEAIKRAPSVLFYIITYPVILGTLVPLMRKVLGYNKKEKSAA